MDGVLQSLQDAIQQPAEAGLAAMWDLVQGLWLALIAGIFGLQMLRVATGHGGAGAVQGSIGAILTVMLGQAILVHLPELAQFSVGTSSEIAAVTGSSIATPTAMATFGLDMFSRALDHGAAQTGYLGLQFWRFGHELAIDVTGMIILLAYLWLALVSLSAFVELYLSLFVNAPLAAFLGTPGFGQASVHPISNLMSSTIRLAGLGIIASLGAVVVQQYILPEGQGSITLEDCMKAEGAAIGIAFVAWQASKLLSHAMLGGGVGWNGASAAWAATTSMATSVMGGGRGGGTGGGASGGSSAGGGVGGGRASGGGGSPGPVSRRATPASSHA